VLVITAVANPMEQLRRCNQPPGFLLTLAKPISDETQYLEILEQLENAVSLQKRSETLG
jgi:hypothetical protein